MEYNKEKATMAKKDAESKIEKKDFVGAKESAMEAQSLYPGLEGLSQILEILDILLAGVERINGKEDWYKVLGVSPTADDGELKKQYKKWSLKLHPDKNGSVGAGEAFKLISEAYKLLIDKQARDEYNQETVYSSGRALWWAKQAPAHAGGPSAPPPPSSPAVTVPPPPPRQTGEPSMPTHPGGSSAPPRQTGESSTPTHPGGSSMASEKISTESRNGKAKVPVTPNSPTTFFTICHTCRYRLEYPRKYLGCTLMCIRCSKPFQAVEMDQSMFSRSARPVPRKQKS